MHNYSIKIPIVYTYLHYGISAVPCYYTKPPSHAKLPVKWSSEGYQPESSAKYALILHQDNFYFRLRWTQAKVSVTEINLLLFFFFAFCCFLLWFDSSGVKRWWWLVVDGFTQGEMVCWVFYFTHIYMIGHWEYISIWICKWLTCNRTSSHKTPQNKSQTLVKSKLQIMFAYQTNYLAN